MLAQAPVAGSVARSFPSPGVIGWIAACLLAVLLMPASVLLLGPLLFGVPHILSELRVLSRRVRVRWAAVAIVVSPLALLLLLRIGEQFGASRPASSDVVLGCAAMLAAAALRPGDAVDRLGRVLVVAGVSVFALYDTRLTTLLLAHGHNLVALLFLFAWSRAMRTAGSSGALLGAVLLAVAVLGLLGAPDDSPPFITNLQQSLAPGLSAEFGYRLVLFYAFAQLLHYVVWLVWMPGLAAAGVPRTESGRWWFPAVLIVVAMGLPMLAMIESPLALRDQYLALSSFHGWLELTALTYFGLSADAG